MLSVFLFSNEGRFKKWRLSFRNKPSTSKNGFKLSVVYELKRTKLIILANPDKKQIIERIRNDQKKQQNMNM